MAVNYNDVRFTQVNNDKDVALQENEALYNDMIGQSDSYYQAQINASKEWANTQQKLQQEQTDFAIEKIEQQKDQTHKDYIKEQSGAYVDWQKQSNQYGATAEMMASQGLANTGYSESSQVSMYNTYQNRVTSARETYNRAILNYDNAIKDARLQNNSILAEIAYNSLQQQLELSLQGFQYKNQLILDKAQTKREIDNTYYSRYQDVLNQINHEIALAEQQRQYNETLKLQREQLAEQKRQHNETLAEQRRQFNARYSSGGSGSGGGSSSIQKSSSSSGASSGVIKASSSAVKNATSNPSVDMDSVLALGYGPISASRLNELVASGKVIEYQSGGKLKYRRATTGSNALTSSQYLPNSVKKKLGLS